LKLP